MTTLQLKCFSALRVCVIRFSCRMLVNLHKSMKFMNNYLNKSVQFIVQAKRESTGNYSGAPMGEKGRLILNYQGKLQGNPLVLCNGKN